MLSALIPYLYFVLLVYLRVIYLYILSHSITMFRVVTAHLSFGIFLFLIVILRLCDRLTSG